MRRYLPPHKRTSPDFTSLTASSTDFHTFDLLGSGSSVGVLYHLALRKRVARGLKTGTSVALETHVANMGIQVFTVLSPDHDNTISVYLVGHMPTAFRRARVYSELSGVPLAPSPHADDAPVCMMDDISVDGPRMNKIWYRIPSTTSTLISNYYLYKFV
jgi:hypothetical protein